MVFNHQSEVCHVKEYLMKDLHKHKRKVEIFLFIVMLYLEEPILKRDMLETNKKLCSHRTAQDEESEDILNNF